MPAYLRTVLLKFKGEGRGLPLCLSTVYASRLSDRISLSSFHVCSFLARPSHSSTRTRTRLQGSWHVVYWYLPPVPSPFCVLPSFTAFVTGHLFTDMLRTASYVESVRSCAVYISPGSCRSLNDCAIDSPLFQQLPGRGTRPVRRPFKSMMFAHHRYP